MTNFPLDKITPSVNNFVAFVVREIKKKRMIVVSTSTDGKTNDFSVQSTEAVLLLFFFHVCSPNIRSMQVHQQAE